MSKQRTFSSVIYCHMCTIYGYDSVHTRYVEMQVIVCSRSGTSISSTAKEIKGSLLFKLSQNNLKETKTYPVFQQIRLGFQRIFSGSILIIRIK
jgi:hypothetical protein